MKRNFLPLISLCKVKFLFQITPRFREAEKSVCLYLRHLPNLLCIYSWVLTFLRAARQI